MEKDLGNFRKSYGKGALSENALSQDPFELFQLWFNETLHTDAIAEPNAMTLSTIGLDGYPKGRVVLLKEYSNKGFVFYTNYGSEKGLAIGKKPEVCLSFFWPALERQVIIKGMATKVSENMSDTYFDSRPVDSKLGAIVSDQSTVIESREVLEQKLQHLKKRYLNEKIPRPADWGGYLVKPVSFEFWQGRASRLHDRIRYSKEKNANWKIERLAP